MLSPSNLSRSDHPVVDVNGTEISYSTNGVDQSADLPVLVLVHGAGGSKLDWPIPWRNITEPLVSSGNLMPGQGGHVLQRVPVFALDLPGHGDSSGESQNDVAQYGEVILGFLEALDLRNVCLVGHSMGVAIALSVALKSPPRVTALCLLAGAARMTVSPELLDGLANNTEATVGAISRACWHKSTLPMFRETGRRRMLSAGAQVLANDFQACASADLRDSLKGIITPALVVGAKDDRMVQLDDVRNVADQLPTANIRILEGCGHFIQMERSGEVAAEIAEFLAFSTAS